MVAILEKGLIVKDHEEQDLVIRVSESELIKNAMKNNEYKWYPVYTNPRAEKKACELLSAKGVETYLPLQKRLKQWSDRKKWVYEPLISSYLFVKIQARQFQDVLSTQGVCRFIYFSGKVAQVPEKQIDYLRLMLSSETDFEVVERPFRKGEPVYVTAGPLLGLKGELVEYLSHKKFLVRLGDTGKSLLVQIPSVFLEVLPAVSMIY